MGKWKRLNKTKAVMLHLQQYGSITSWQAIKEYGATRLSAIIYNLRNTYNMNIQNEIIEFTDRYGTKSSYVKYIYDNKKKKSIFRKWWK